MAEEGIPDSLLQRLLGQFFDAGIVTQDQQDNWLLTRDLEDFSLLDLYQAGHFHLPLGKKPELPRESDWDGPFLEAISVDSLNMAQPLKTMYQGARQARE